MQSSHEGTYNVYHRIIAATRKKKHVVQHVTQTSVDLHWLLYSLSASWLRLGKDLQWFCCIVGVNRSLVVIGWMSHFCRLCISMFKIDCEVHCWDRFPLSFSDVFWRYTFLVCCRCFFLVGFSGVQKAFRKPVVYNDETGFGCFFLVLIHVGVSFSQQGFYNSAVAGDNAVYHMSCLICHAMYLYALCLICKCRAWVDCHFICKCCERNVAQVAKSVT